MDTLYRLMKLPGANFFGFFNKWSLWLADDHLLSLRRNALLISFSESYQRFYFKDIRAIHIKETGLYNALARVCGGLCLGIGMVMGVIEMSEGLGLIGCVVGSGLFALAFVALLLNWKRGPTCQCVIETVLQRTRLNALGRVKAAERFREILTSEIEKVQGKLSESDKERILAERILMKQEQGDALPPPLPSHFSAPKVPISALSFCLLVFGLATVADFVAVSGWFLFAAGLIYLSCGCITLWVLIVPGNRAVKRFGWAVLIYLMVLSFVFYGLYIGWVIVNVKELTAMSMDTFGQMQEAYKFYHPSQNSLGQVVYLFHIVLCVGLAFYGFMALRTSTKRHQQL